MTHFPCYRVLILAFVLCVVRVAGQAKQTDASGGDFFIPGLKLELKFIKAGSFLMGSSHGPRDEQPVSEITISRAFWLGKTEVTQSQWVSLMGENPSRFVGEELPVEQVSWNDAMDFCARLTLREKTAGRLPQGYVFTLPTEAQWEFACRAGAAGDHEAELDEVAWYADNSGVKSHAVGRKRPNSWGLHDMHGNVWEWCLDFYGTYPGGAATDPIKKSSGSARVRRGGGWGSIALFCRSAYRSNLVPTDRLAIVGFRLALSRAD